MVKLPPKSEWPPGPWLDEPDRCDWIDETTRYLCIVNRHWAYGTWVGYVGIPEKHPCARRDINTDLFRVHGGITYVGDFLMLDPNPEGGFWFGFDCAHSGHADYGPFLPDMLGDLRADYPDWPKPTYKTFEFARDQCRYLALQLKAMESGSPPATHGSDG
jgi:hypothetical protein